MLISLHLGERAGQDVLGIGFHRPLAQYLRQLGVRAYQPLLRQLQLAAYLLQFRIQICQGLQGLGVAVLGGADGLLRARLLLAVAGLIGGCFLSRRVGCRLAGGRILPGLAAFLAGGVGGAAFFCQSLSGLLGLLDRLGEHLLGPGEALQQERLGRSCHWSVSSASSLCAACA
ncbi:hypothetical protein ACWGDT_11385 [Streptomyces avermitilis]